MTATGCLAFAAAQRVIDRVHRHTAVVRLLSTMTSPAGFADRDVLVLDVSHATDRRVAANVNLPHLTGGKSEGRPLALTGHELREHARRTGHLRAFSFLQLDVVNRGAERDC